VRSRLKPEAFRRWFLIAMILLGTHLAESATYNVLRSGPLSCEDDARKAALVRYAV
jgi:hypothetical protein